MLAIWCRRAHRVPSAGGSPRIACICPRLPQGPAANVKSGFVEETRDQCSRCGPHLDLPFALIVFQECSQVGALRQCWVRRLHSGCEWLGPCANSSQMILPVQLKAAAMSAVLSSGSSDCAVLRACFALRNKLSRSQHAVQATASMFETHKGRTTRLMNFSSAARRCRRKPGGICSFLIASFSGSGGMMMPA